MEKGAAIGGSVTGEIRDLVEAEKSSDDEEH